MPLPSEEATPPVTKMCFVTGSHPIPARASRGWHFTACSRGGRARGAPACGRSPRRTRPPRCRTLSTTTTTSAATRTGKRARQHHAEADGRTERVGAGVAEHQLLAQVEDEEAERRAEHHRDPRPAGRARCVASSTPPSTRATLVVRPGARSSRLPTLAAPATSSASTDEPRRAVDVDRPGHGHRDGEAAEQLEPAGREPALRAARRGDRGSPCPSPTSATSSMNPSSPNPTAASSTRSPARSTSWSTPRPTSPALDRGDDERGDHGEDPRPDRHHRRRGGWSGRRAARRTSGGRRATARRPRPRRRARSPPPPWRAQAPAAVAATGSAGTVGSAGSGRLQEDGVDLALGLQHDQRDDRADDAQHQGEDDRPRVVDHRPEEPGRQGGDDPEPQGRVTVEQRPSNAAASPGRTRGTRRRSGSTASTPSSPAAGRGRRASAGSCRSAAATRRRGSSR